MIPRTKAELLQAMEMEHGRLLAAIEAVPVEHRETAGVGHAWSVKDVLAHLVAWKRMFLGWYAAGRRGENPRTPAEDLNWRQTPALNQRIYEEWRGKSWTFVEKEFNASWAEMMALAQSLPEEELFRKGLYPWMRVWPLGRWIAANTSSHYRWARGRVVKMRFASIPECLDR